MRVNNSNIGYSRVHNYTVEKVKWAMEFVNKTNRFTSVQEWLDAYNYLKGTNKKLEGCRSCAATKYIQGVKNYAKLGYLVLLNEGHKVEEFKDEPEVEEVQQDETEVIENEEKRIVKTTKPKKTTKRKSTKKK